MPQYLLIAHDSTREGALEHRLKIRPIHLEFVKKYKTAGNILIGGAMLNESNTMKGSAAIYDFASENEMQEYLANEPYITQKVWESYEIIPFKVAQIDT